MIVIKEELLVCNKMQRAIRVAGAEAIQLWLALKRYCSIQLTDGFVPDIDIDHLDGAPKDARVVLKALVECGNTGKDGTLGAGLVEPAPHGWQLHDYLDHSESAESIRKKRERGRERKQLWDAGRKAERVTNAVTNAVPDALRTPFPTRYERVTNEGPNPTQPNPDQEDLRTVVAEDLTGLGAKNAQQQQRPGPNIPCTLDLSLTPTQSTQLTIAPGIPPPAQALLRMELVGKWADSELRMTPAKWQKYLVRAMVGEWNGGWRPRDGPPRGGNGRSRDSPFQPNTGAYRTSDLRAPATEEPTK